MKYILLLSFALPAAIGQTGTASIGGKVLDAKTLKPVSAAWVIANRTGAPPLARNTKSGGDGAFTLQGLMPGTYSLCVDTEGDQYLDPCQWNGNPTTVTLGFGQNVTGTSVKLAAASVLNIQLQDPQKVLSQTTTDGRRPDLSVGVWGPKGLYYPAHISGTTISAASGPTAGNTYSYRVAIPLDTALKLFVASHDLKLGDAAGVALPANTSQASFEHATGDPNPKSFSFTALGLLP